MRTVAGDIFKELQKNSDVKIIYNPVMRPQLPPGIMATINNSQITMRQLEMECIERHGVDVLDGTINHRLLEMACKQQNVTVTDKEIDEEVARAASLLVKPLADGSPDVRTWIQTVTKKQGVSVEVYRRDSVWPSVALRKLAAGKIDITEEDLKKGFEANYGPRVRCRAIVMNNLRRAQEVWRSARDKPTVENFSELASKYSIEGSSRALGGEVPPIRKYGGQPLLEDEAFALKAGELSGIIQMDDKFLILFCEGRTTPVEVEFSKVRSMIYDDIHEKKQRLAMADYFQHLQDTAKVDNFLDGTSRSPAKNAGDRPNVQTAAKTYGAAPKR
jgi:hypothetical protein